MKKTVTIILLIVGVLLVLAVAGVVALHRYVQSPRFKEFVLAKTREPLAVPLDVGTFQASLLSGFELQDLLVQNPPGSQRPHLLETRALVFRHRLLPLLRKKVEIETIYVDRPTLVLEKAADGTWNYEKLLRERSAREAAKSSSAPSAPSGLSLEVSRLAVADASVVMLKPDGSKLVELDGLKVESSLGGSGTALAGRGQLTVERALVIGALEARDLRSALMVDAAALRLPNVTGRVEGGTLSGSVLLDLQKEGYPYAVHAELTDVDVVLLGARFSDKARYLTGKLALTTDLEGVGGDTMALRGKGVAQVRGGTLTGVPLLQTVAQVLRTSDLERIQFDEITLEYTIGGGVIETPVLQVLSKDIQLTGSGRTDFDLNLNHQLTLSLSPAIFPRLPREIAAVFGTREDGFRTLTFQVSGPADNPKTDLAERLLKGAAGSLLEKGLQQFLGGEKKKKEN